MAMENDSRSSQLRANPDHATPSASHSMQVMRITEIQKQALIDNLQLEGKVHPVLGVVQCDNKKPSSY